jgi:hypothetical protein
MHNTLINNILYMAVVVSRDFGGDGERSAGRFIPAAGADNYFGEGDDGHLIGPATFSRH